MSIESDQWQNPYNLPEYPQYFDLLGKELKIRHHELDLIVVPAARGAEHLLGAAQLAYTMDVPLAVLCSKQTTVDKTVSLLSIMGLSAWYAIDIPKDFEHPQLSFTAGEAAHSNHGTTKQSDLSLKRNIGMLLTNENLLFLDDDIKISQEAAQEIALFLSRFDIVGGQNTGFPDSSVVYHALQRLRKHHVYRAYDHHPGSGNLSGNCMGVKTRRTSSHFPDVYNEDWLFAYRSIRNQGAGLIEANYQQDTYAPFQSPERAANEEFGEIIIQGLFDTLQQGIEDIPSDPTYWLRQLDQRRRLLDRLHQTVDLPYQRTTRRSYLHGSSKPGPVTSHMEIRTSLEAAMTVSKAITAASCVQFIDQWQADDLRWAGELEKFRNGPQRSVTDVLGYLGLTYVEHVSRRGRR